MAGTRNQKRRKLDVNDFFCHLPDDILLLILSKLGLKDAARTAILSTRWKNLWTLNATCLNIDASEFIPDAELIHDRKRSRMKTLKFVKTAGQILRQHRAPILHQLSITYPIGAFQTLRDSRKVEGWIDIAITKQVKALNLDFKPLRKEPVPFLSLPSAPFFSLVSLSLKFASLTSHTIHSLFSNSPNLQDLSIIRADGYLQHLEISGPSLKLKRLELVDNDIEFLEISAPNLSSFNFSTQTNIGTDICFKDVPLLTQLSYSEKRALHTRYDYSILLPQLEKFTLILPDNLAVATVIPHFPASKNLKQLHLTFVSDMDEGLCLFFRLFKASPSLCRLSLNFETICPPLKQECTDDTSDHKFLREIEIDGFCGTRHELDLVICIAQSSSSLENIIIHPSLHNGEENFMIRREYVSSVVKKLASKLSQKKLEILSEERNLPTWKDRQDWEML